MPRGKAAKAARSQNRALQANNRNKNGSSCRQIKNGQRATKNMHTNDFIMRSVVYDGIEYTVTYKCMSIGNLDICAIHKHNKNVFSQSEEDIKNSQLTIEKHEILIKNIAMKMIDDLSTNHSTDAGKKKGIQIQTCIITI